LYEDNEQQRYNSSVNHKAYAKLIPNQEYPSFLILYIIKEFDKLPKAQYAVDKIVTLLSHLLNE
jgi:hypothetical protein